MEGQSQRPKSVRVTVRVLIILRDLEALLFPDRFLLDQAKVSEEKFILRNPDRQNSIATEQGWRYQLQKDR